MYFGAPGSLTTTLSPTRSTSNASSARERLQRVAREQHGAFLERATSCEQALPEMPSIGKCFGSHMRARFLGTVASTDHEGGFRRSAPRIGMSKPRSHNGKNSGPKSAVPP